MDFVVYPNSRISKLPRPLQFPALLLRNLFHVPGSMDHKSPADSFKYCADGIGTDHYCPFLDDSGFDAAYQDMVSWWYEQRFDCRWRMWLLTCCARQCTKLPGSFVEFGVYRGGCAFMIFSTCSLAANQRYYLFDTFSGIPGANLTEKEAETAFAGRHSNTSVDFVASVLGKWSSHLEFVPGDVFDTLCRTETGCVAFCHLDLNASKPTQIALQYIYSRLVPGAILLMDDYGWAGYEEQRGIIDRFFSSRPECLIGLPTGQAMVVKT